MHIKETQPKEVIGVEEARLIISEVRKAVKGKDDIILKVLLAILAKGHILLEDIPGVGKTTLAMAFSKATSLDYNRVQFTPDVMPSDVTGFTIYKKETETFEYVKGAVLCNFFLADEINRTSSKTQSALLEVMEEGKVTVDLKSYDTPKPFTVIATQNPVGHAGTQMLPESQLDRFLMRLTMGYPDKGSEIIILKSKATENPLEQIKPVVDAETLLSMQNAVDYVHVHDAIYNYIVELIGKTRTNEFVELGASPRGSVALAAVARARAYLQQRDYVLPCDVQNSFIDVISHRIILKSKAKIANQTVNSVLTEILNTTKQPLLTKDQL
ncbi:MoxR family ATPase [Paludicola sp. MB14-C6]|uniref:AAA family ATPase n=1 Tax=Paludihabitans sp. MB14-C6 TaxID=3070656 RepID=UPI0027DD4584|nr:MoxR family ATPase [Paludicola sp. MB14-C6]WMJ22430.1 MoxR family ATPase [Paludicola sp. MB14-C6]